MFGPVGKARLRKKTLITECEQLSDFVRKSDEHECMAWPYVEMVLIEQESWVPIPISACRHFQFNVLIRYVYLLVIHPVGKRNKRRRSIPITKEK
jgi:hypothetical protein